MTTPEGDNATDLAAWQLWWAFNKDAYLNLKSHIGEAVLTGSDESYLSHGSSNAARDTLRVSEETIRGVIVPRLLEALRTEKSVDIESSCMIALAKIGDAVTEDGRSPMAEAIQEFLASGNQELSETAAVALGILANRANIALLTAVLDNDGTKLRTLGVQQSGSVSVRTRAFAAYGLGLIGCKACSDDRVAINATLRRILEGEGKTMAQRDIQVACLTSLGLSPLEIDSREGAADLTRSTFSPASLASRQDQLHYLLAYFADNSNNALIRAHAPTAMARLLSTNDVPADFAFRTAVAARLMASLSKNSTDQVAMQQSCALALGVIGDCDEDPTDRAIRASLMHVKDELVDQQTRNFALIALAQASGRPGRGIGDPLYGLDCEDKQENSRWFLLNEMSKGKHGVRAWSGIAIAVMERAIEDAHQASSGDVKVALRGALAEARSPSDIGAFAIACGLGRDRGSKEILLSNLDAVRDAEARGYTAIGLGLMEEQSASVPIREVVKKSKYSAELLKSAAIGLGMLGDENLVPELVKMLASSTGLASQAAISSALGTIGDARSVDPLIQLTRNQDVPALVRAFGAVALGIIADKEPFPWNAKIGVNSNYRANTASLTDQKGGILDIL